MKRRVVVTGLGGITPLSRVACLDIKEDWKRLVQAAVGIRALPSTEHDPLWKQLPSKVAANVPFQDDSSLFTATEHKMMSRGMKLGLVASGSALSDARLLSKEDIPDPDRSGVAVGTAMVDLDYIGICHKLVQEGSYKKVGPYFVPRILPNLAPGQAFFIKKKLISK